MSNLGMRIKSRREELGMSQDELALKVGYSGRSSVNKVELGKRDIPRKKVAVFAEALGVSVDYLMGSEPEKPEQPIQYHADMIAHILGYDLGGDPSEGIVTLTFDGVDREITLARWELYEKGLILYAKHLLNEIYEEEEL